MERKTHWNQIYATREAAHLSWHQALPAMSLRLIAASGISLDGGILDVGGGASRLVDALLAAGYRDLAVLDVSRVALDAAAARLGAAGKDVEWIESDVTSFVPQRRYALWHDRAVFHFLIDPVERAAYLRAVAAALAPDGQLILATFAPSGPEKCSNLPVQRYGAVELVKTVGDDFVLLDALEENHTTPGGVVQPFTWCRFARR